MRYFYIEPEVAGGFGPNTIVDRNSGRMVVKKLHYVFDGWLGDELLESTPSFLVSQRLAGAIEEGRLTGATFDDVEVSTSDTFTTLHPGRRLPKFYWFKVVGVGGKDDFGITPGLRLLVSERALSVLQKYEISHAEVTAAGD